MKLTTGIVAALAAPLLEAVGFLEWDIHWYAFIIFIVPISTVFIQYDINYSCSAILAAVTFRTFVSFSPTHSCS